MITVSSTFPLSYFSFSLLLLWNDTVILARLAGGEMILALNKLTQFAKHSLRMCYIRRLLQRQDLMRMQLKKGKMIGLDFFPFKILFVEKKLLWEMTRCGAPIVWGICPGWTGVLFEMGLKWDTVCACWPQLWLPFSIQYWTAVNEDNSPMAAHQDSLRKPYHLTE